jgi:hypothetical protein
MLAVLAVFGVPLAEAAATTTTLALSSSSVTAGTAVVFTATVSNGSPVTLGTVTFCNAAATYCLNPPELLGTAQLTSAGTAVFRLVPGIGSHSYKAIFNATTANATSTSSAQAVTVTGLYPTTTAISPAGSAGSYSLTATVVGTGSLTLSPTGSVSFLDATNSNYFLAPATLGASTYAQTFASQVSNTVGGASTSVAAGDFNGDGILDLAVASNGARGIDVLIGTGAGTFAAAVPYQTSPVSPGGPISVAVGDFNNDGKLDVATTGLNGAGVHIVSILLGNGDGTFQTAVTYPASATDGDEGLTVADFNGDGKLDLAVANDAEAGTVGIYLGNGDGTFQAQVTYATGNAAESVVAGDFRGDGRIDLVVGDSYGTVSVLLGNGNGTFATYVSYAIGGGNGFGIGIAAGDFIGNGHLGLAVADGINDTVDILMGNGDGTFQGEVDYATGGNGASPSAVAIGDFNGDGIADLAVTNSNSNTVGVLLGVSGGTFEAQVSYGASTVPRSVVVGDFNGDGNLDLAVADGSSKTVGIFLDTITQTATAAASNISVPGTGSVHQVDASYPSDTNFATSLSGTTPLTSSPVTTGLTLIPAPTSSIYTQQVVLTATLTPYLRGSIGTNGETVTFYNGATDLGTGPLSAGVATLNVTALPDGVDSLTAVYAGDTTFLASTSPVVSYTVSVDNSTTTTLALSSSSVAAGTAVTFTATVLQGGAQVTAGTVNLCNSAFTYCLNPPALLGTAQLTSAGTAVFKLIPSIGSHSYYAVFKGTDANAGSNSSGSPQVLGVTGLYPTTTTLISGGSVGAYTLTGTVVGDGSATLTGSVSFIDTTDSYTMASATLGTATLVQAFAAQATYTTNATPTGIAIGDFNGDGIPDVVVTNQGSNTVGVFLGTGNGTFGAEQTFATGSSPYQVVVGDFNKDGRLDIAVANSAGGSVSVLLNTTSGGVLSFAPQASYTVGTTPESLAVGDFNGDGNLDLAVANFGSANVSILLGSASGVFGTQTTFAVGTNPISIAVGDFIGNGRLDLAVANNGAGTVGVLLGNGEGAFGTQVPYGVGTSPSSVVVGDFLGNGILDLVASNQIAGTVSVLLGTGSGTFGTQTPYAVGTDPVSIAVGDFNEDGNLDLVVANYGNNNVGILLGNGVGGLAPQAIYTTSSGPYSLAVGSFDGDGNPEVAVANQGATNFGVLLSQVTQTAATPATAVKVVGSGTVHQVDANYPATSYYSTSTSSPTIPLTSSKAAPTLTLTPYPLYSHFGASVTLTATLAPYNAGSLTTNGETVTFYNGATNLGPGTLSSGVATLSLTTLPVGTASLTATYPGDTDFTTSTSNLVSYSVSTYVPTSTTLALSSSSVPAGTMVTFVATVNDGAPVALGTVKFCDVTTATYCLSPPALMGTAQLTATGTATIRLAPGPGSHSYTAVFVATQTNEASTSTAEPLTVTAGTTTTAIVSSGSVGAYILTATVVGNGALSPSGGVSFLDTSNSNVVVSSGTLGTGTLFQTFSSQVNYGADNTPTGVVAGDFAGNGIQDLVVADSGQNKISVLLGTGTGTFATQATYTVPSPQGLAVGDFNGDGKLDLVVVDGLGGGLNILLGNGDGTFQAATQYYSATQPYSVTVADFNADGKLDLAVANNQGDTISILLGNGDGTFQAPVNYVVGDGPEFIAVGDFKNNGILDLAVTNTAANPNTVSILFGTGTGTFGTQVTYPVGFEPEGLAVGDFRGLGRLDLAVVNNGDGDVGILLGNGDGTFQSQTTYSTGSNSNPSAVAIGDFNGDGIPDLAVANQTDPGNVGILLGTGTGTFQAQVTYLTGSASSGTCCVAVADFNGDGIPDVAAANSYDNNVSVLLDVITRTATTAASSVSVPGSGSTHQIDAVYAGNTFFSTSTSPSTVPLTSSAAATTLTLAALPTSSVYGQTVVLTATLAPYSKGSLTTNTETVTFYNGATNLGPGTLTSGVATANVSTLPGGTDGLTAVYGGDTNFLTSTSTPVLNFTVSKATPTVNWTTPAAIPFGTVLSATQLDASPSVPGTPVYTPLAGTTPATGTDTLSVAYTPTDTTDYSGDSLYPSTTTNPVKLSTSATPDFAVASSTLTQTVTAGQSATYTINVTPSNGFASKVTFTASGMPTGATAVFAPSSVTPNGAAVSSTLTIATAASTAAMHLPGLGHGTGFLAMSILSLPLMGIAWLGGSWLGGSWLGGKRLGRQRSHRSHVLRLVFLATLSLGMVFNMAACGGGTGTSGSSSTPKTYTITITATSASLTHSTAVTLIVN